jgi:hypothetical protein
VSLLFFWNLEIPEYIKQIDALERDIVSNRDYGLFIDPDTGKGVREEVIGIYPLSKVGSI